MNKAILGEILILTLIFVLISSVVGSGEVKGEWRGYSQWIDETNTTFAGGYGECVSSDGNYLYILRQYNSLKSPYFYRYDPRIDKWKNLSENLPSIDFKNGLSMAYDYSGDFYVLAGSAYADGSNRVYFYKYNISTDAWIRLADTPHVQGAGDAIVYSGYDDKLYAFIGRAHYTGSYTPPDGNYSVFARYDPDTNTWENLKFPPWPGTDDGCSLAWTGGRYIYALEGEFYENQPIQNFARYDIDENSWSNMCPIPAEDGVGDGGSLLWIGYYDSEFKNVIFALDGNGCNETPGYNFSMYYIINDTWVSLDPLPYPVGDYVGNRIAYVDGKIWFWQGTPESWYGGGKRICSYDYSSVPIPEVSMIILPMTSFALFTIIYWRFRERI